jgi:pyruvate dehydrogenase E1 component
VAAATAYSTQGIALLPFYIYYSIFGFQRVGDLIWAAADQRARGFLLGATAGRTTLGGEGLQHQDGSSHLVASTIPNCRAWDPAFAGELAVILEHGARRMLEEGVDEFHYITMMNESYAQPSLPEGAAAGVLRGMYRYGVYGPAAAPQLRLLGSGAILREVIAAAEVLAAEHGIACEVWSVTSFSELARDAAAVEREARLAASSAAAGRSSGASQASARRSYIDECLCGKAPVVAATDYVRAVPQMVASHLPGRRFIALGTDGFGRSDTRSALRAWFEVDCASIIGASRQALAEATSPDG